MKNVLFAVLQCAVFFVVFGYFSFFPPLHLERILSQTAGETRIFIWDGLLLSLAVAVLFLVVEAVRGRIQKAGPWTTAAFVLSSLAGLLLKFGFLTRER